MNVFQSTYDERLRSWYDLRTKLNGADTKTKCVEIDAWWQRAPLVNHYLHPHDAHAWPGPWELISENNYCHVARGLGMYYTLALTGVEAIDFCQGKDDNNEDVMLVLVDDAKYILNYYPDSVLSSNLRDFKITARMDLTDIIKKIK